MTQEIRKNGRDFRYTGVLSVFYCVYINIAYRVGILALIFLGVNHSICAVYHILGYSKVTPILMEAPMALDIRTIAFIQGLILLAQVLALFIQYRLNKRFRGVELWLAGSVSLAVGSIFASLYDSPSLFLLARIANPLLYLGYLLLYAGVVRFLDRKENRQLLTGVYVGICLVYYYFMFVQNSITGRAVVVSLTIAVITLMTAHCLLSNGKGPGAFSARFVAIFFAAEGVFMLFRTLLTLLSPPIQSYSAFSQNPLHIMAFVMPIITSTLWTFGFGIMVNQRLNAENKEEKDQLKMIFNTSPDAVSITRLSDGLFVDVNAGFLKLGESPWEEIIGKSSIDNAVWYDIHDRDIYIKQMMDNGFCENMEFFFMRRDGSHYPGLISGRIITLYNQPHIYSVVRDISEWKRTEAALIESEGTYRSILNASPDDITITDMEGRILMVSQAAKKMFDFDDDYEGFTKLKFSDFIVPEDVQRAQENIRNMFINGFAKPNEYRAIRRDGTLFDVEVNSGFVTDLEGKPNRIIIIVRDITARKEAEQQIQRLIHQLEIERNTAQINSITDSLTGLANRRYFDDAMNAEFHRLKRSGAPLSMIMLDVDHFKLFNDTYGHLAGDACLQQISAALKSIISRMPDIVARFGGEEFVVILPETEHKGAVSVAEKLRAAVEALSIPHAGSEAAACVTVSLGVVTVQPSRCTGPAQIVMMADEAMYRAKQEGRNRVFDVANA